MSEAGRFARASVDWPVFRFARAKGVRLAFCRPLQTVAALRRPGLGVINRGTEPRFGGALMM